MRTLRVSPEVDAAMAAEPDALWLQLVSGGEEGILLVFVPEKSLSKLAARTPHPASGTSIEALRLRADLTYRP
ncbi:MAG TPA: hypothetical protein VN605_00735 [Thermoanaerobaculia bacterium]|nr:hypothetical protein [Thermoanaerobaculia bacterium]